MSPTATIYIVDDDASAGRSLGWLLESVGHQVCIFDSPQTLMDARLDPAPDCLILDVRMPGTSGLELHRLLLNRGIDSPVIFITAYGEIQVAVQAMKQGAMDFIEKPFNGQALLNLVHKAIRERASERDKAKRCEEILARLTRLTEREQQVLDGVIAGKSSKVIAAELDICPKTIDAHRGHIMKKMGVHSATALVGLYTMVRNSSRE